MLSRGAGAAAIPTACHFPSKFPPVGRDITWYDDTGAPFHRVERRVVTHKKKERGGGETLPVVRTLRRGYKETRVERLYRRIVLECRFLGFAFCQFGPPDLAHHYDSLNAGWCQVSGASSRDFFTEHFVSKNSAPSFFWKTVLKSIGLPAQKTYYSRTI